MDSQQRLDTPPEHPAAPRPTRGFGIGLLQGLLLGVLGAALAAALVLPSGGAALAWGLLALLVPPAVLAAIRAGQRRWSACCGSVAGGLLVLAACAAGLMYIFAQLRVSL